MTKATAIIVDSYGIARGAYSDERAIRAQEEAEQFAFIAGDFAEANRRRHARENIERKSRRRVDVDVWTIPPWLVEGLGGARDAIVLLMKSRDLSSLHGQTAIRLREHTQGITITIEGNGAFGVFVDGGQASGLEDWCDKRRHGVRAWTLALGAVPPRAVRPVRALILGKTLTQAGRLYGGDTAKAHAAVKLEVGRALDAATAYLGARL